MKYSPDHDRLRLGWLATIAFTTERADEIHVLATLWNHIQSRIDSAGRIPYDPRAALESAMTQSTDHAPRGP